MTAGRRTWALVAQMVEHLMHNREVVGSMPTWVSPTFSSQHGLAQIDIYIFTMHKADRRTTNDEDDEHSLPQVLPGEITSRWSHLATQVTWIGDG